MNPDHIHLVGSEYSCHCINLHPYSLYISFKSKLNVIKARDNYSLGKESFSTRFTFNSTRNILVFTLFTGRTRIVARFVLVMSYRTSYTFCLSCYILVMSCRTSYTFCLPCYILVMSYRTFETKWCAVTTAFLMTTLTFRDTWKLFAVKKCHHPNKLEYLWIQNLIKNTSTF